MKLTGTLTCKLSTVAIKIFGKDEAAAATGASASTVIDFVIAASPMTVSAAEAVAAYLRKSLRASSAVSSASLGIAFQLRNFSRS